MTTLQRLFQKEVVSKRGCFRQTLFQTGLRNLRTLPFLAYGDSLQFDA